MASRQSVGSILKPPKIRAPLKEIEHVDQEDDENTASLPKRKVSFSGMNKIKMYNTGATSLTVHQAPMFDETISMLSDSSNGEKTKLSGKFEKSDGQINFESNNCTSVENNGRVIIEYESPNDNMEMTEALSGKIFTDTISTIGNNVPEHFDYSSDYSERNMEFTEAVKIDQIITVGMMESFVSSTEIPETLNHEDELKPNTQYDRKPLTPLANPDGFAKNTANVSLNSSDMEFTYGNTKIISMDLSCINSQSSNMEFTCMTPKFQEFTCSNDGYTSYKDMDINTQLPIEPRFEDNCELINEGSEKLKNSSCEHEMLQNDILCMNTNEINNDSNKQFIDCAYENFINDNNIEVEEISLTEVSMDIDDPVPGGNENDISYVNVEVPISITNEQNNIITPTTEQIANNDCTEEQDVPSNYSKVIEIGIQQENSRISTDHLCDPETSAQNVIDESLLNNTSNACTFALKQNHYVDQDTSSPNEKKLKTKNYSRKTMIHSAPIKGNYSNNNDMSGTSLMIEKEGENKNLFSRESIGSKSVSNLNKPYEYEILSDTSMVDEENPQKICSRKSIAPASVLNSTKSYENEVLSDTSMVDGKSPQKMCSRKSIVSVSVLNSTKLYENDIVSDSSMVDEENPQKNYSSKSTAPASVLNSTKSYENEVLSDTSMVDEEIPQKICSRKSIAPTSVLNSTKLYENEVLSDSSMVDEENPQKNYSSKSTAPASVLNSTKSYENEVLSDTSMVDEEIPQKICSRKSIAPTSVLNSTKLYENEVLSDSSMVDEENPQKNYSSKSTAPASVLNSTKSYENEVLSDTSMVDEEIPQKICSRKSIAPTFVLNSTKSYENEVLSDSSMVDEENPQKNYSSKSTAPASVLNSTKSYENEVLSDTPMVDEEIPQKICSRKSIAPTFVLNSTKSYENDIVSDTSMIDDETLQRICSRKSFAPKTALNPTNSYENYILSDTSEIDEINLKKNYSRRSITPKTVLNLTNSCENDTSVTDIENLQKMNSRKSVASSSVCKINESREHDILSDISIIDTKIPLKYSRKSIAPTSVFIQTTEEKDIPNNHIQSFEIKDNNAKVSMSSEVPMFADVSNRYEEEIIIKSEYPSGLLNVLKEDDFNSPFRKKSRKSVVPTLKINQEPGVKLSAESKTHNGENLSNNLEYTSKMDISIEFESKSENVVEIPIEETNVKFPSSPRNGVFLAKQTSNLSVIKGGNSSVLMNDLLVQKSLYEGGQSYQFLDILPENNKLAINVDYNFDEMQSNELENVDTNLNELDDCNKILKNINKENTDETFKTIDDINKTNSVLNLKANSSSCSIDKTTTEVCVEGLSNMSITDEMHHNNEKLPTENRKRSYSSRNCGPISCSSFMSKPNTNNSMNVDDSKEYCIKESPIKENVSKDDSVVKNSLMNNITLGADLVKEESVSEHLCNEALEFLTRWKSQFVEKILILNKCTNQEWTFNVLDNNVIITVSFSPVINEHSFLKVEDISFTTMTAQDEITKFGINWILLKYNPKIYKQICFTSRDVELLLKSLLEDVQLISSVMKNMVFMKDFYCVKFKDDKAQFVLHSMKHLFMARIDISLLNIHKISIKDISVDFLFGSFDLNAMCEIVENIAKDCNVLQALIEKLENLFTS